MHEVLGDGQEQTEDGQVTMMMIMMMDVMIMKMIMIMMMKMMMMMMMMLMMMTRMVMMMIMIMMTARLESHFCGQGVKWGGDVVSSNRCFNEDNVEGE